MEFKKLLVILIVLVVVGIYPVNVGADLASYLEKDDKLLYEIIYYRNNVPYSTDYYEVDIVDKYVSTELYFTLEVKYNGVYGSLSKKYGPVKIFDLSMYIPSVQNIEYITMSSSSPILLTVPVPVKDWNELVDRSSPIAAKALSLKLQDKQVYELQIGSGVVYLYTYVLTGSEFGYSYKVYVDNKTGLLIRLDAFNNYGDLVFTIKLMYYNRFTEYIATTSTHAEITNTTTIRANMSRITFTVILATISIIVLLVVSSRFARH